MGEIKDSLRDLSVHEQLLIHGFWHRQKSNGRHEIIHFVTNLPVGVMSAADAATMCDNLCRI